MTVTNIVLTGGPCAGKSTGLAVIKQRLINLGYDVVIMHEMATEVILSGLHPAVISGESFQAMLLDMQINRMNVYKNYIDKLGDKVVILHDRGLMDGEAYVNPSDFEQILNEKGLKRNEIYGLYDGVFHLVSAAIGAPEAYTKANNEARMETLDEAAAADVRTMNAWVGHPHLRIINNEGVNFEQKMNKLMEEVLSLLGEPIPLEIERKFLVKKPDMQQLIDSVGTTASDILQTYLVSEKAGVERRIRQRGLVGDYSFFYTEKAELSEGTREEREKIITLKEYINLLGEADITKKQIKKRRYCFVYKDKYFELDVYPFWKDQAILEIEVGSIDEEFEIPEFIEVIKEVTNDKAYKNSSLAETSGVIQEGAD